MNYTIAYLKQCNGNLKLNFNKNGKQYCIQLYNTETKELTTRNFELIDDAMSKFNILSALIIKNFYSEKQKREILLNN